MDDVAAVGIGIRATALILSDSTEVVRMLGYFEGVLLCEASILDRVHRPVTLKEHAELLRDVRAIEVTLTTCQIGSTALGRIEHIEALTLPDAVTAGEFVTVGSPEHIEGLRVVLGVISPSTSSIRIEVARLHDAAPALISQLLRELTAVSRVVLTL